MFESGDHVALREIFRGRVWRAFGAVVVRARPDLLAFWVPEGTEIHVAVGDEGHALVNQPSEWILQERRWASPGALRFAVPGEPYSIWSWDGQTR